MALRVPAAVQGHFGLVLQHMLEVPHTNLSAKDGDLGEPVPIGLRELVMRKVSESCCINPVEQGVFRTSSGSYDHWAKRCRE